MLNMKFLKIWNQENEEENVLSGRSQKSFYLTALPIHTGTLLIQMDFLTSSISPFLYNLT